ncbi:hypothetical protein TIFTF001_035707 [Ficus carica]|uniref:Zinc finger, CCHC-type n=1 Tax=Ficus carica TaxID=3494 RepID=A0AA88E629_FICCA|nr:hypothetical protein TIFTF001_035707 [Ficus carica]
MPAIDAPDREFVVLEHWDNSNLSAMQIMDNLEEMFGEQTIQAKTDAIKGLMNCKQKVGTPIKEHMMKIMAYLSEAQANGAEIDAATQWIMAFQTLSKDFDLFQASYNLNRKEMKKAKGKNKGNKPAAKATAPKKSTKTKKRKVDPKKAKCFFYGKKRHFKKDCRDYLTM